MTDSSSVTLAVVAILATCVAGLLWIIKFMFNKLLPMIEKSNEASKAAQKASNENTKYLKERNGRDAEIHQKLIKEIQTMPERISQEVHEQHIERQEVKAAEIKEAKISRARAAK